MATPRRLATLARRGLARAAAAALVPLALAPAIAHTAPPPGTAIVNVATGTATPPSGGTTLSASNPVTAIVQASPVPPVLAFYADPAYTIVTRRAAIGRPLWLAAVAPAFDRDPAVRDTVTIAVRTDLSGDDETYTATESGPSTGVFRVEPNLPTTPNRPGFAVRASGVLELQVNDEITAVLFGGGAPRTETRAWVEPRGEVFDARGGAGVAGATVSLIDVTGAGNGGSPGGPARVWLADGVTPAPSVVTTDAAGAFDFAALPPSTYRLAVRPPGGYRFPSSVAPPGLPPTGHPVDAAASYGSDFVVAIPNQPVRWGMPVDALPSRALVVRLAASPAAVEIGDVVDWTVDVESRSDTALAAVAVTATLPPGFRVLAGSARRDTTPLPDPATGPASGGRAGTAATFAIGPLGAQGTARLRLRTRVGPGALDGDGIGRAFAFADTLRSNEARARVIVTGGAFAEEASILGAVFVDRDGDARRGPGEPGLPGVRLWLDDGTWVITDREGRYSLYGIEPRSHALRVDPLSLPAGVALRSAGRRDLGTPGLIVVDLQRGELHRADVPVAGDSLALAAARERAASGAFGSELARAGELRAESGDGTVPGDPKARPASGVTTGEGRLPLFGAAARDAATGAATTHAAMPRTAAPLVATAAPLVATGAPLVGTGAPLVATGAPLVATGARTEGPAVTPALVGAPAAGSHAIAPTPAPPAPAIGAPSTARTGVAALEDLAAAFDPGTGFVDLADGDTLATAQVPVRVKGALGLPFELVVNGQTVPARRAGLKVTAIERGVEAWEYVGVNLREGVNVLTVTQWPAGGRPGGHATIRVTAPGRLARVALLAPRSVPADGHSIAAVRVRAIDAGGVPVAARAIVTLEATAGHWQADDLDPATPGFQVAVENGETAIGLLAPRDPAVARLAASCGTARGEATLAFVPEMRPLIAVGLVEGTVAWSDLARGRAAARPRTGFETGAEQFRSESRDGDAAADARASLFVKGRVAEDVQLTLGYASDKPEGLRRFRDVQPDAFYPLYGDGSVRGYEAQSTGRLYARLDRHGASLLYGDFVTRGAGNARSLAAYHRSLTGAQAHWESARLMVDAFSSRDRTRRRIEELPGLGTSGPYLLPGAPIVENSERVEIVTRDRHQPAIVLRAAARERFSEYEIDPFAGRLLFKNPVPSFDADLNPVSVRVTYEVESGGEPFWVSGAEGRVKVHERIELGGTYVDDHDPLGARELRGAFVGARLSERTALEAEWAGSRAAGADPGHGGRFELRHESAAFGARAYASATDTAFDNPGAGFGAGRVEAGGRLNARLSERSQLRAEALYSADEAGASRRGGGLLAVDHGLSREVRGELGMRVAGEHRRGGGAAPGTAALRARLGAQLPRRPELSGFLEAEQNLPDSRRMAALGGEYRFAPRARLYARHELISSLAGPYALDGAQRRLATVAGVDADLAGEAHAFGEYRLGDAVPGREAEAALGLRNAWRLDGGMRVGLSFERVSPLLGSGTGPTTAFTGSVDYAEGDDWKGSSRFELRTARASDAFLHTMAAAVRLDSAWTALGRNLISVTDERAGRGAARGRMQIGFAYRQPRREDWDALGRYELRYDREAPEPGLRHRRVAHVVSTHATGRLFDAFAASGGWAGKRVHEREGGTRGTSSAQWIHGRFTWAFGRDWDAGIHGSLLALGSPEQRRHGLGVEAGRQLPGGVWLSAGWNRFGYEDPDFADTEWTREGAYLRIRARFDETLLGRAGGAR